MNFRDSEYCTNYKANDQTFLDQPCFSKFFNSEDIKEDGKYEVYLVKNINFGDRIGRNHYLLFNEDEILEHMAQLQKIIPSLKYNLTSALIDIRNGNRDCYVLSFSLSDKCSLVHKYALTWVRYLYEFPYNIILKEAYKLKFTCHSPFNRQSISNLYMVCSTTFPSVPGIVHSVNYSGYFIPNYIIKERLHRFDRLNNIYEAPSWAETDQLKLDLDYDVYTSLEYWNSPEKFLERIPYYLKTLYYLKHRKNG